MNSATNNEMALRYYCAIETIGWNKPGNKSVGTSLFKFIHLHAEWINRAKIRRPYSALFWQYRERMEKEPITSGKNAKYVRARNRSYYRTME